MAQLMPLPLTVSRFSKIQIGFTFLVPAHPASPGQRAVKRVCARVPTDETAGLADDVVAALEGEYPESLRGLGELGHAAEAGLQEFDVQWQKAELDDAPLVGVVRRQLVECGH